MRVQSLFLPLALLCSALLSGCVETLPVKSGDSVDYGYASPIQNDTATRERLKAIAALQERLDFVAAPLLIKNQSQCKKLARPLLGFTAKNRYSYSPSLASAAQQALNLGEELQVTGIMAGSGAAHSGLQIGDTLVSAGGKPLPQGPNSEFEAPAILVPLMVGQTTLKLSVLRKSKTESISLSLTQACGFRVELGNVDTIGSYADGRRILVTRGMLSFVRSDAELAYVIAKEMAHNALGHPARLGTRTTADDAISHLMQVTPTSRSADLASAIKPMPKDMDLLADRLAVYMLARAGIPIDGVAAFWQRLAKEVPQDVAGGHTALHPATAQRLAAITKTVESIGVRKQRVRSVKSTKHPSTSKSKRKQKASTKRTKKRKR